MDLWALRHTLLSEHTTLLRGDKYSVYQPVLRFSFSLLPLSFFFSSSVRKKFIALYNSSYMYLASTFGNGPQVNEQNLFFLLMFNLSIGCFSIVLLPSIALRVNDVLLLTGHKMTCFKEVIRMPGALTGRCGISGRGMSSCTCLQN